MAFDSNNVRHSDRVYLTQDAWDALRLVKPCAEHRDKFIEDACWTALSAIPGVVDVINQRKELLRKFKEQQKEVHEEEA